MTTLRTGGCLCGAIRYESSGEPVFALQCHCRDCQRQSGSAYVAAVRVPAAEFHITKGNPKHYIAKADSGNENHPGVLPRLWQPALCTGLDPSRSSRHSRRQPRRTELVSGGGRCLCQKRPTLALHEPRYSKIPDLSAGKVLPTRNRGMTAPISHGSFRDIPMGQHGSGVRHESRAT